MDDYLRAKDEPGTFAPAMERPCPTEVSTSARVFRDTESRDRMVNEDGELDNPIASVHSSTDGEGNALRKSQDGMVSSWRDHLGLCSRLVPDHDSGLFAPIQPNFFHLPEAHLTIMK